MSVDADAAEKLLAAAKETIDLSVRFTFIEEARILIRRERQRLVAQALLLDQLDRDLEGALP